MKSSWDMIIEWGAVALFIGILIYTMIVVKEEKTAFKESAIPDDWDRYRFHRPSWWTDVSEKREELLKYERTDTRYEWWCEFWVSPKDNKEMILAERMVEFLQEKQLEFDEVNSAILNVQDFQSHQLVKSGMAEMIRIEGTCTEKGIHRRYIDVFLVNDKKNDQFLWCFSMSSVLNGLVEGPYFEETVFNLEIV